MKHGYCPWSIAPAVLTTLLTATFLIMVFLMVTLANGEDIPALPHEVVLTLPIGPDNPRNSEGSAIRLANGELSFVYTRFYGKSGNDHDTARLCERRSTDGGRTWSAKDRIVLENEGKMNVMSVSLLRLEAKKIAMFYLVKENPGDCRPYMRVSTDEGKSWGPRALCIPDESYNVVNNDRVVRLKSGRLLMPVAWHPWDGKTRYGYNWNAKAFCLISDDQGKTWRRGREVAHAGTEIFQEPGLVQVADGRVLMYIRTNGKCQFYSWSSDGGETWTQAARGPLDSPLSPAQIKRIPGSDLLLAVWNPYVPDNAKKPRCGFDAAILSPDGSKILRRKYIEKTKDGNFQYPNITFVNNEEVVLGYFTFGGDAKIVRFNLKDLMPPKVTAAQSAKDMLADFLEDGMPEEILYAVRKPSIDGHWYANFGHYSFDACMYPFHKNSGGKICVYNVRSKQTRTIFEDPQGNVRDPQIHYDGKKIVFSYLPAGEDHFSLFELNLDGTGLKRLTGRELEIARNPELAKRPYGWDDIEPVYLPDGQIVFCSSRINRYVQCWATQVATLHKCDADGGNVRTLSCNVEHDNTPWVLSNGQVLYMRWEYIDRFHMGYHHLWTMNPDGTRQMVFYGNQASGGCFLDAKPIPDSSGRAIGVFSPGHGRKEHYGRVAIFDSRTGPDAPEGMTCLTAKSEYADPWAFSENRFMAACKTKIVLLDDAGKEETLCALAPEDAKNGFWLAEPRPIEKRRREPVIADATDPASDHGTFALANVYHGRQMKDVAKGTIKELLIYEALPKPINYSGAMSEISSGGTFAVERLLGSVPVSKDGSAYFNVPPLRALFFVALDEKGHCVKRMHSFTSVMPGEKTTCIGCHEDRLEAPSVEDGRLLKEITNRDPSRPQAVDGVPEIIDFQRDVQPILDRHCLACHNPDREDGDFNISGHWGPLYTIGYQQMSWRELFGDNRVILPYGPHTKSNFKPYEIGTGSSRLLKLIEERHQGVDMPEPERKTIRFWLEAGAAYSGTYCCNSWGTIGYYNKGVNNRNDKDWPETAAMTEVIKRRCDSCHAPTEKERKIGTYKLPAQFYAIYWPRDVHQKNMYLAHTMSEDGGRFNRHVIFDLSYPEQSKIARAPLSKQHGGLGVCEAKSGKTVFADTNDEDYRKIVAAVARGRKYILEENPRFCMSYTSPNNGPDCPKRFFARPEYIYELIGYGVLPKGFDPKTPVDPFELDRKYWQSMWYKPVKR